MLAPSPISRCHRCRPCSADGRCKTFDAAADGYRPRRRLWHGPAQTAERMRRPMATRFWPVIKGSAVNHDGPSSGLTVPNTRAQEKVLRQALANAQVSPDDVGYVEAHGTGTSLGDPIEIRALGAVFGSQRADAALWSAPSRPTSAIWRLRPASPASSRRCWPCSIGQIPPHLHFSHPNPYIEWDEVAIAVPTTLQPWPRTAEGQPAGWRQRLWHQRHQCAHRDGGGAGQDTGDTAAKKSQKIADERGQLDTDPTCCRWRPRAPAALAGAGGSLCRSSPGAARAFPCGPVLFSRSGAQSLSTIG